MDNILVPYRFNAIFDSKKVDVSLTSRLYTRLLPQTVNKPISHLLTSSAFVLRPFTWSSLHRNQTLNSSFLSSDVYRPRNEAPGIAASVRIESRAAIAVAMLKMHDTRGLAGLALVLVVTILPE